MSDSKQAKNSDVISSPEEKNAKKKPRRKLFRLLRIFFLWVPLCFLALMFLVVIGLNFYLSEGKVEKLARENYKTSMNGRLDLKVEKFSLFSGFVIKDIVITNPEPFSGEFARIDRLVLDYSLPRIFTGSVRFYEIGIYSPKIHLIQKKGLWNYSALSKPGKDEPEPVVREEAGERKNEINLPVSVDVFLKFVLSDLQVVVDGDTFSSHVKGLDFSTELDIPPVKKIPLGPSAVSLIKHFDVKLNPQEKLDVAFSSKDASIEPPLILMWSLSLKNADGAKAFESRLKAGTYNSPVRFKSSHLGPLNFMLGYDLYLDPVKDFLKLNSLYVSFKDDKWIELNGIVDNMSTKQKVLLSVSESRINLTKLFPYYKSITGDRSLVFGGSLSLYPFSVHGTPENITADATVSLNSVYVSRPDFELKLPSGYVKLGFNGRNSESDISAEISFPNFVYRLDRSWSKPTRFALSLNANSYADFSSFLINSLNVKAGRPFVSANAFSVNIGGRISLSDGTSGSISILPLDFSKTEFAAIAPLSISESLEGLPFEKNVQADIRADFSLTEKTSADVDVLFRVPDFNIKDMTLKASVIQDAAAQKITVKKLSLESREFGVALNLKGTVKTERSPISDSDLKLSITADSRGVKKMKGMSFSGKAKIDASMSGDLESGSADGSVMIEDFNFENPETFMAVKSLNLQFPFEYDFSLKHSNKDILAVSKSGFFDNINFSEKDNFTVASVKSKHPSRKESFEYLRDFRASMSFKENIFRISTMKALVMNGSLSSRGIMFYLADMKKENMQYKASLEATNIDIALFDSRRTKADALLSMNMDLSGKGIDTARNDWFVNGYLNIYRIGDKFANRLMKGLSEEKGKSKLGVFQVVVDRFNLPGGFYFNFEGSNLYATVKLKRKIIGQALHFKDDEIRYDRMPIKEYLRNVGATEESL